MPHDVFISYSSIDRKAADAACAIFEQRGIRCWIAPRDVPAGSEWAEAIIDAIEAAKVMVLIFSSNSNESRQVRREVELAVGRGVTVMPLRLEQFEPTRSMAYFMAGVHWIDALTPPLDTHLRTLADWIKPHLGSGGPIPEPPRPTASAKAPTSPPPKQEARRAAPNPAAPKSRRKGSSIFGDFLFEFFGVGAKEGGVRMKEAGNGINAAKALGEAGKYGEAIAAYRALIERIEDVDSPSLDWNLSIALVNLAITYRMAGRTEEALTAYRNVVRKVGDIADQMVEKQVAVAMNNHATLLTELGRAREAVAIQDEVVERFADTINTDLARQLAIARLNRGLAFSAQGRPADAVAAYDDMASLTNLRVWPKFDPYVAHAQANKANSLITLKRYDEAVAACDLAIARPRTPEYLQQRAVAMRNKVVALRDSGRKPQAVAAADAMLAEFGKPGEGYDKYITDSIAAVRQIRAGL